MIYRIGAAGCGVSQLALNDRPLPFERDSNPHRTGAALVAIAALAERLAIGRNLLAVQIG